VIVFAKVAKKFLPVPCPVRTTDTVGYA